MVEHSRHLVRPVGYSEFDHLRARKQPPTLDEPEAPVERYLGAGQLHHRVPGGRAFNFRDIDLVQLDHLQPVDIFGCTNVLDVQVQIRTQIARRVKQLNPAAHLQQSALFEGQVFEAQDVPAEPPELVEFSRGHLQSLEIPCCFLVVGGAGFVRNLHPERHQPIVRLLQHQRREVLNSQLGHRRGGVTLRGGWCRLERPRLLRRSTTAGDQQGGED